MSLHGPLPGVIFTADISFQPEKSATELEWRGCPQWVHVFTEVKMKIGLDELSIVIH